MKLILLSEKQFNDLDSILTNFARENAKKFGFGEIYSDIVSIQVSLSRDVSFDLIDRIKTVSELTDTEGIAQGLGLAKNIIENYLREG
ncbi:MAG: hypothetical protein WC254_07705 [Candidatus Woesearchaeota archaeon]|jgi:hypothetical protein